MSVKYCPTNLVSCIESSDSDSISRENDLRFMAGVMGTPGIGQVAGLNVQVVSIYYGTIYY